MAERIQKILAASGAASRRKAEALIAAGRVCVNGIPAQLGQTADAASDEITVDGVPIRPPEEKRTLLLYKPRGYVTTVSDEQGRRTVMELVPQDVRLFPVGRLDRYSEGLLLMTNDGELANRLMHPRAEVDKLYHLWVSGYSAQKAELLRRPVVLDGKRIRPPSVRVLSEQGETAMLSVKIHEGRNRQIRRMCELAGLTVTRLKRVQEGELRLGELQPGTYRELTPEETDYLQKL